MLRSQKYWVFALMSAYPRVGVIALLIMVSNACALISPLLFSHIIDSLPTLAGQMGAVLPAICFMALLALGLCLSNVASSVLFSQSTNCFQDQLRCLLWRHLNAIDAQKFEAHSVGHWQSKLLYDISVVSSSTQSFISALLPSCILLLGSIAIIACKEVYILGVLLLAIAINGLFVYAFKGVIFASAEKFRHRMMKQNQFLIDLVSLIPIIKIFLLREQFCKQMEQDLSETRELNIALSKKTIYLFSLISISAECVKLLILILSIYLFTRGYISMGEIVLYQVLITQALGAINQIFSLSGQLEIARDSYLSLQGHFAEGACAPAQCGTTQGRPDAEHVIEFKDCTFQYDGAGEAILKNFSFRIKRNSSLSIYGQMGVGKTTFTKLITGLYAPTKGQMQLNLTRQGRTPIVAIGQTIPIFENSLLENIRLFDESISEDMLSQKVEELGLQSFYARFSEGWQTPISQTSLSGGQTQCIGILRALVREPEILILDEVTNNLDIAARLKVYQFIQGIKGKVTIVAVSHDLELFYELEDCYVIQAQNLSPITSVQELSRALRAPLES